MYISESNQNLTPNREWGTKCRGFSCRKRSFSENTQMSHGEERHALTIRKKKSSSDYIASLTSLPLTCTNIEPFRKKRRKEQAHLLWGLPSGSVKRKRVGAGRVSWSAVPNQYALSPPRDQRGKRVVLLAYLLGLAATLLAAPLPAANATAQHGLQGSLFGLYAASLLLRW